MKDSELSVQAGKNQNYLAHYKCTSNPKYQLFKKFGILGFTDECARVKEELSVMYYELYEKKHISKFGRDNLLDEFRTAIHFNMWLNKNAFSIIETMSATTYNKAIRVLKKYKEKNKNEKKA